MNPSPDSRPAVYFVTPGGLGENGGIGRLVATVTQHWREARKGPPFRVLDPYGPAFLPIAPLFFARALLQLLWGAARGRVALLHVNMATGGSALRKGIVATLGRRLGLPVVVHLHGNDTDEFYWRLPGPARRWLRRTLERADRVLVLGRWGQRVAIEVIGLDPGRVVAMPNAVRGPDAPPRRDATGPCRILFLGRIEQGKGLMELLDALADPRVIGLDWVARLAGRGRVRAYRARAAALGLTDRVEFTGWLPEARARRELASADVFVLPSHQEGLSMALLEAMAFGLAVVTTPVGATEDAVRDGESGLLVPVGEPRALAEALARVVGDRSLRERLQANARRRFLERFDIADYGRRLEEIYRDVRR